MKSIFSGRAVFVFSDPGGAKPLLALADSLRLTLIDNFLISDREYPFYKGFVSQVQKPAASAHKTLQLLAPDFVLTATSYTSQVELEYIKAAKELQIPVYSFIDHWTSMRERFNMNGNEVLPDQVLVIDERAKKIAVEQGIPEQKLVVFGNPYHAYLKDWKPAISKTDLLASIGITETGKNIVVYAPDPLSNIGGVEKYGFDEVGATIALQTILGPVFDHCAFIFKPHPNQNLQLLAPVIDKRVIMVKPGTDVNTLLFYSDTVIGFFSSILIEASLMNKKVIRFFCNKIEDDPLGGSIGEPVYPETLLTAFQKTQLNV